MDGDGREQNLGLDSTPDDAKSDGSGPIRPEGRGEDRHGGGALNTDRSDKAVTIQGGATADDYSGSSESGA